MEVVQTPEETLRIKSGSCRDFAWLLIHVLRHFGLATICIWLYCTIIPDVKSLDGPSGPEKILQIYMPGSLFTRCGVDWT
jgi:transglutaminase-like putative cysteine protease